MKKKMVRNEYKLLRLILVISTSLSTIGQETVKPHNDPTKNATQTSSLITKIRFPISLLDPLESETKPPD